MARCKCPRHRSGTFPLDFTSSALLTFRLTHSLSGFKFATTPRHIIGYAIIIIIVSGIVIAATIVHDRRRRRKAVFDTPAARNFQNAYVAPEYQNAIPLAHTSDPPPPYTGR